MPDPMEHAENRGWLEEVLRRIPGFRGYLEKEYRRESDRLQRQWLIDRLQRSKRGLDALTRSLVDTGEVDALPQWERVRGKLDQLIGRIRGAVHGYSGVFDLVTVDEAVLDQVYEHDAALVNQVDELAAIVENLDKDETPPAQRASQLLDHAEQIARHWDERADILKGLD
jgi:hypothetical protein